MHSLVMIKSSVFFEKGKLPVGKLSRKIPNLLKYLLHLLALGIYRTMSLMVLRNTLVICMDVERRISIMFDISYFSTRTKVIDMSLLPPCQSTLKLHASRANVVVKI